MTNVLGGGSSTTVELPFQSASSALSALACGEVTATELTEIALLRIEALNPSLNALREVFVESALREAHLVDEARRAGRALGSLAGLPVVIKENIDTTPGTCSAGLDFLDRRKPMTDAWATAKVRTAGAIVLGTSISDPGGFGTRTALVRHPSYAGLTVGGSSGGSAAALAAGLCLGALGTDTGGSIRIPASCCEIVGLKPTKGRLSTRGVFPLAWTLDHVGPMAARVADLQHLLHALDPMVLNIEKSASKGVLGYDPEYYLDAEPAILESFDALLRLCSELGFRLQRISLPKLLDILPVHAKIFSCESGAFYLDKLMDHAQSFPSEAKSTFDYLRGLRPQDYVLADRQRSVFKSHVEKIFETIDFILTPTLPVLSPPLTATGFTIGGQWTDFTYALVRYTALFNHTGHPALCQPGVSVATGGRPGIQIIGRLNADAELLAFGLKLESALQSAMVFKK
jgi:Asp-tRNA(Asn)/Glu-tRNA(Gln) amidotransferase A subunit family amidase